MDAEKFERQANKILIIAFIGSILFVINMFIGNILFSVIGFFTIRFDRVIFLTASLFSYAYILCAIYYNWTPFGDQDAAMRAALTDGYKFGLIIINTILALFSLILLVKELKSLRTPKCPNCGSRKGVIRKAHTLTGKKGVEKMEIPFACKNCGHIIFEESIYLESYQDEFFQKIIDKIGDRYRYNSWRPKDRS